MTNDEKTKTRWRMTLDELCYRCRITVRELDYWAQLGALGPRLTEPRDRGWHRHITREVAQRAVIMNTLLQAGLDDDLAARTASEHELNDSSLIVISESPVRIVLERWELNLP